MTRHAAGGFNRWLQVIAWGLLVLLVMVGLLLAFALVPTIADPTLHYADRKGQLVEVKQTAQWHNEDSIFTELTLVSSSGLRVELSTRIPKTIVSPRPMV